MSTQDAIRACLLSALSLLQEKSPDIDDIDAAIDDIEQALSLARKFYEEEAEAAL